MIGGYPVHPLADTFPLIEGQDFDALVESIKREGLSYPIVLKDGVLIDGRNRLRACRKAGVEPKTIEYEGDDVELFIWHSNLLRRELTDDQRAMLVLGWEDYERERAKKRQQAAGEVYGRGKLPVDLPEAISDAGEYRDALAKRAKVSPNRVRRAKAVKEAAPDLAKKVEKGEMSLPDALREVKREEIKKDLETVAAQEIVQPTGLYDVIVIDPPWPMTKIERDQTPEQVAFDYPTMTEAELRALSVPCSDNCHVWLWTTHKFLPLAFDLLATWRLKYVCTFVWHKPGGFQPFGLPQYNCEFALYARRGSPQFIDTKALPTCFDGPRGAHSEKPEVFYETLRRVTGGRRLDMFNRRTIEGFDGHGKEAASVLAAK